MKDEPTLKAITLTAVKWIVLPMLVVFGSMLYVIEAQAEGYWFKTIQIKAGAGTELFECREGHETTCGEYDVAEGVIGKFSIAQSIYSQKNLKVEVEWDHLSGIKTHIYERPIDYIGINLSAEFDWY